jgi:hypothetical protein
VLDKIKSRNGGKSYLLPMAFPEGCPTHPAYPSGHATVAGACVTVLKALFNETHPMISDATTPKSERVYVYVPSADGKYLVKARKQMPLSVGGELNKLASNIATFRELAGVHWKSDGVQGILLGEQIALKLLLEQTSSAAGSNKTLLPFYRERTAGPLGAPFFRLTLFSGQAIDIADGRIFQVDGAYSGPSTYHKQGAWQRAKELSFSELVRLQGFPAYA